MNCPKCKGDVLDIDVKCPHCGAALSATGAHRMIGATFLGTYELVDVLGQGGMSVVFKAKHKLTEQEVALKILPPELAAHSQVKSRFLDEAGVLKREGRNNPEKAKPKKKAQERAAAAAKAAGEAAAGEAAPAAS